MPLLRRKPFVKKKFPSDFGDDEEAFYCELTNEIFRDYEEFCQRVILCNSLVWSCSLTGKPQLTYQEALQSEENARMLIKSFPKKLVLPVLYLASQIKKSSLIELIEEVFSFVRERYFIGETVEVSVSDDTWCTGCIERVIPPTEKEIAKYLAGNSEISYRECETAVLPAQLFSYKVKKLDGVKDNVIISAKAVQVRRHKGVYTREKNRLLLKNFSVQKDKVWVIKDKVLQKYSISKTKFENIFCGNLPEFEISKNIIKMAVTSPKSDGKHQNNVVRKEKRQETIQKYFKSPGKVEASPRKSLSPEKQKTSNNVTSQGKKDTFIKKQSDTYLGKLDTKKKTLLSNKKEVSSKKSPVKQDQLGKKLSVLQQKQEKSPKKKLITGTSTNGIKKTPKKLNSDSIKSPQKQQLLAKKVKDKYKDAGNLMKRDVTKNLLEKHKMDKTSLKQELSDRLTLEERRQKLKEEKKERALEEKRKRVEEKLKEKAKLKEEKLRLAEFLKQWNRQREDLECEDLKELPEPTKVQCAIPNEAFGDFVMVLEFLHTFGDVLSAKDIFPGGVTFELVERALSVNEVAGPLSDIIQLLLNALFNMQEEEDDEILETDNQTTVGLVDEVGDITTSEAVKLATCAASWCQLYQGMSLNKVTLDSVTLTEVLRLHLLSSGGRSGEMSSKWRYQQRGGYTSLDDPGLLLRIQQPHILRALSVMNVCELPLGDKLKVLTCLINQILTYAAIRDIIDESGEKVKQLRGEIRAHQLAELKKEREAAAIKLKERKEAKLKLKGDAATAGQAPNVSDSVPPTETPVEEEIEEKEVRHQRLDRESSRRKQEIEKKSRELYHAAFGHQVLPIGSDRAHRRFWLFSSLPGLFVENDEHWIGSCLEQPTPYNPTLARSEDTLTYVRKLFEEEWNGGGGSGSDKENEAGEDTRPVATSSGNKKLLTEKNTSGDSVAVGHVNNRNFDNRTWTSSEKLDDFEKTKQSLLICTADVNTCPVHGCSDSFDRTKWAFFCKEEDINHLIECLNKRGIREGELRQNLLQEKLHILQNLSHCPVHKLDPTQVQNGYIPEPRKSSRSQKYEDANLSFPPGTPADEIFELTLRDFILELEEKLQLGGLGSLKVYSREVWRNGLNNRNYDKQCDKLVWGMENHKKDDDNDDDNMDIGDIPLGHLLDTVKSSNLNPSDTEIIYRDPGGFLLEDGEQNCKQNPVVHDLASAILQIAQSVEKKYLKKPLGTEDGSNDNTLMKRWESSLMACTSFSQLFLHFSSLDNSIQWSRSVLYANCRICRRRTDAENMLLCDGCNKGHHLYCLKPKLIKVPQGDWFCPKCRPPEKVRASKKSRRLFSQESDEDDIQKDKARDSQKKVTESEKGTCSTCGVNGPVICCYGCSLLLHPECVIPPLRKIPRGKWFCPKCKAVKDGVNEITKELTIKLRRCSANAAVAKISVFAKRLRSNSWDDTSSVQSDSDLQPTRRSGRRSLEVDLDLPLNNAVLQDLLTDVMHHKDAWPFLRPVPRAQVPDYHLIIKRPMDFGKMKYKLNMLEYRNNSEFIADALLIFENCQMYNQVDAQEFKAGVRLGRYFEKRCRELGLQLKEEELLPPETKKARLG